MTEDTNDWQMKGIQKQALDMKWTLHIPFTISNTH